mmetsp:Transcript_50102/g.160414  ORF Transcript_50102/g.160414 Transcript_50102/m.160414 type:complete len:301 (-) Transcript_50102:1423-2325(-)
MVGPRDRVDGPGRTRWTFRSHRIDRCNRRGPRADRALCRGGDGRAHPSARAGHVSADARPDAGSDDYNHPREQESGLPAWVGRLVGDGTSLGGHRGPALLLPPVLRLFPLLPPKGAKVQAPSRYNPRLPGYLFTGDEPAGGPPRRRGVNGAIGGILCGRPCPALRRVPPRESVRGCAGGHSRRGVRAFPRICDKVPQVFSPQASRGGERGGARAPLPGLARRPPGGAGPGRCHGGGCGIHHARALHALRRGHTHPDPTVPGRAALAARAAEDDALNLLPRVVSGLLSPQLRCRCRVRSRV